MKLHSTAIVEDGAKLGNDVRVGAYSYIGKDVVIGDGCNISHHVTIEGKTTVGLENKFFPYCSVGTEPQDLTFSEDQDTGLSLGDHNVVREFVTINRGTNKEPEAMTRIGSHCLLMAYVHIAHDCVLGDHIVLANNITTGGHVRIGNHVSFGGFVGVHHFATVGDFAFIGGWSRCRQDIPPFLISEGVPPEVRNLNHVGLRRAQKSEETIAEHIHWGNDIYFQEEDCFPQPEYFHR